MNEKLVKFYPYAHTVIDRIFSCEYNTNDSIDMFRKDLHSRFKDSGLVLHPDNKTVYEVEVEDISIFYGFYDWIFSIGLGIRKLL